MQRAESIALLYVCSSMSNMLHKKTAGLVSKTTIKLLKRNLDHRLSSKFS